MNTMSIKYSIIKNNYTYLQIIHNIVDIIYK